MKAVPEVSVIMANFNGATYLAEAIRSVQAQTLSSWELIVADDASTDGSLGVAEALAAEDPRIRVLSALANRGAGAARNRALDVARGRWIAVFDSDDVMAPDRLERLVRRAHEEGALIVADNQLICSSQLAPERPYIPDRSLDALRRVGLARFIDCGRLYSSHPDLGFLKPLVSAALIAEAGARYDEDLRIGEDFHFLLALLARGAEIHIEPEPLYLYRKHGASISHRFSPEAIAAMIAADQAVRARLAGGHPEALKAIDRRIHGLKSWATHERVMGALKVGRLGEALSAALGRPHAWPVIVGSLGGWLARACRTSADRPQTGGQAAPAEGEGEADASSVAGPVCAVIAARNAGWTIGRAVRSALAEAEVGEVVVVDDGSTDDTAAAARAADDGSGRLLVLRLPRNLGPAAARNRAIAVSSAPYVTVLDADDYWLPGRMARLLSQAEGCDFVADDLLRVLEGREDEPPGRLLGEGADLPRDLSLAEFARANVSRRGRDRQELGFLKPLMRRTFLEKHQLAYAESLRLGEDFVLYAQALARGARFRLVEACGYVAVERQGSISGSHGAAELDALLTACKGLAQEPGLGARDRAALALHRRHVRSKRQFRRVLDMRRHRGMPSALRLLAADPRSAIYVVSQAVAARFASHDTAKHRTAKLY